LKRERLSSAPSTRTGVLRKDVASRRDVSITRTDSSMSNQEATRKLTYLHVSSPSESRRTVYGPHNRNLRSHRLDLQVKFGNISRRTPRTFFRNTSRLTRAAQTKNQIGGKSPIVKRNSRTLQPNPGYHKRPPKAPIRQLASKPARKSTPSTGPESEEPDSEDVLRQEKKRKRTCEFCK
jgi:hypothetical protein